MNKLLLILLLSLPVFFQCGQKKNYSDSGNRQTDSSAVVVDTNSLLSAPAYKITKIDSVAAERYVVRFRKWTETRPNPVSLCTTSKDTLKWIRLLKNKITNHVAIDQRDLEEFDEYDGIRIYPCIDDRKVQNYILVYTKIITTVEDGHDDDLGRTFFLEMKIPGKRWCELEVQPLNVDPKTSHHLCKPHCADDTPRL